MLEMLKMRKPTLYSYFLSVYTLNRLGRCQVNSPDRRWTLSHLWLFQQQQQKKQKTSSNQRKNWTCISFIPNANDQNKRDMPICSALTMRFRFVCGKCAGVRPFTRPLIAYVSVLLSVVRWTDALLGNSCRNHFFRNSIWVHSKANLCKDNPYQFSIEMPFTMCMQILLIELRAMPSKLQQFHT